MIDKLAWIYIKDGELLVARSKGKDTFYIPGGKRENGESDEEALIREIKEELSVDLVSESISFAKSFEAQAHGRPAGEMVKISCFFAQYKGELAPDSEIEEITWVNYDNKLLCSPATQIILDWLKSNELVKSLKEVSNMRRISNKVYKWILFDADETLFHFDAFKGLQFMFSQYQVDFTPQHYKEYQEVNKPLWVEYQNGSITALELKKKRFQLWADKLGIFPEALNSAFLSAMADICEPLEGAENLLKSLEGKAKLGIITNGFAELQTVRLQRTGFDKYISLLVSSEEAGVAKPDPRIFNHALSSMGNTLREEVLMIGDTPESDILGGFNAGMDTCWLNTHSKPTPPTINPVYQVSSLTELEALLKRMPSATSSESENSMLEMRKGDQSSPLFWKPHAASHHPLNQSENDSSLGIA